jgi:hypothetical protein
MRAIENASSEIWKWVGYVNQSHRETGGFASLSSYRTGNVSKAGLIAKMTPKVVIMGGMSDDGD